MGKAKRKAKGKRKKSQPKEKPIVEPIVNTESEYLSTGSKHMSTTPEMKGLMDLNMEFDL